jgi:hypothetical protein
MHRRDFLRHNAIIVAALSFPWIGHQVRAAQGQRSPNDRLQIGFIGVGGRARWILTKEALPGAEVVAVADCFLPRCAESAKLVPSGAKW